MRVFHEDISAETNLGLIQHTGGSKPARGSPELISTQQVLLSITLVTLQILQARRNTRRTTALETKLQGQSILLSPREGGRLSRRDARPESKIMELLSPTIIPAKTVQNFLKSGLLLTADYTRLH